VSAVTPHLWLIPALPLAAAGAIALLRRRHRALAAALAIGALAISFVLALVAFRATLGGSGGGAVLRDRFSFAWFDLGPTDLRLGWVLDPLAASMLVMVTLVGLLIFIYSVGYMARDGNVTRFFGFLALFAAAMLGLVMANNLLLLFICWELVGLASYLLIGFWYHKPAAAAAAKKAFLTTRVGDLGFFLGIVWLYARTGTLMLYDGGEGCLEGAALTALVAQTTVGGMGVATAISLLLFCGAAGKSGQLPLHVWLPDAMEGPTPVSALIHAATMVAAGVFLVARVYPLMAAHPAGAAGATTALQVVAWVGVLTAVFAALIAVAQTDIKRILAYSTVSQLGFMMLGLGVGGVAVGMFHLITHAFFKALLFLGAGSVIHGIHEEQDIRRMGGLRRWMPVTFATYAVGMMALSGVPLFFSGFWSKDAILHAAHGWTVSTVPFYLGACGALLTAFYMTRQVCYVFFGAYRGGAESAAAALEAGDRTPSVSSARTQAEGAPATKGPGAGKRGLSSERVRRDGSHAAAASGERGAVPRPHESPPVMTAPLVVLAVFAVVLGFVGTPAWPWFQGYLTGAPVEFHASAWLSREHWPLLVFSALLVAVGFGLGWRLYGRTPVTSAETPEMLERCQPALYAMLRGKFYVDEFYGATVIRWHAAWARICDLVDRWVWGGMVVAISLLAVGLSWVSRAVDEHAINLGFDEACRRVRRGGQLGSRVQGGLVHESLRALGMALVVLLLLFIWSGD